MKMLDAIDRGEPLKVYGDGEQAYDFIYVGDCAAANICAMKADTLDRFYNVGTGKRTTIMELAEMLRRLTGSNQQIEKLPQGLTFVKNRIGCPKRAAEEIGFQADVELEKGLRQLIAWREAHKEETQLRRARAG
jgi:UDP-glucose 4-epimerase